MSPSVAESLGLVESYTATISSPAGASTISDVLLHRHGSRPDLFVEVVAKAGKPAETKEPAEGASSAAPTASSGKVLGRWAYVADDADPAFTHSRVNHSEAMRLAKNEIRRLKRRGIEAEIREIESPRMRLYSISNDGVLQNRDAETGALIWTIRLGRIDLSFGNLGVNDEFVTVVNGSNVFLVNSDTGKIAKEATVPRVPLFGAVNGGEYTAVTALGGALVCYPLDDLDKDPFYESFSGDAITPLVHHLNSSKIAFSTSNNFVYVAEIEGKPSMQFRFPTDGQVHGTIATASGDRFFFGTDGGTAYGIRATRSGQLLWATPIAEPISKEPVVSNDRILFTSRFGNAFCLSSEDGQHVWDRPLAGVSEIIGAIEDKFFVLGRQGGLGVVDRNDGSVINYYRSIVPARPLVNHFNDRLYLVDSRGVVQALRPIDSELPKSQEQKDYEKKRAQVASTQSKQEKAAADNPFGATAETDPFADKNDDPFGGESMDDPFGAGDDPFGAGDDPFGAGDDPFGGNGGDDPFGGF